MDGFFTHERARDCAEKYNELMAFVSTFITSDRRAEIEQRSETSNLGERLLEVMPDWQAFDSIRGHPAYQLFADLDNYVVPSKNLNACKPAPTPFSTQPRPGFYP